MPTLAQLTAALNAGIRNKTAAGSLTPANVADAVQAGYDHTSTLATGIYAITAYGAVAGQDVTAALNAAIAACIAGGGGTVLIDTKTESFIDGPARADADGKFCQILIPLVAFGDHITIRIKGAVAPNSSTEGIGNQPRNNKGSILTSRNPQAGLFVWGTTAAATVSTGLRNYLQVDFENLETRTQPNGSGANFAKLIQSECYGVVKFSPVTPLTQLARPVGTVGYVQPEVGNKAMLSIYGTLMIEGYEKGLIPGEHLNCQKLLTAGCVYGLWLTNQNHGLILNEYLAEVNVYNVAFDGTAKLLINAYHTEHYYSATQWYSFKGDFLQLSGGSHARIMSAVAVKSNSGEVLDMQLVNGAYVRTLMGAGENYYPVPVQPSAIAAAPTATYGGTPGSLRLTWPLLAAAEKTTGHEFRVYLDGAAVPTLSTDSIISNGPQATATVGDVTLTGLPTSGLLRIAVRAVNSFQLGAWSAERTASAVSVPNQVQGLSVTGTATPGTLNAAWTAVANATGYELRYRAGAAAYPSTPQVVGISGTTHQLTGLAADTYTVSVRAIIGGVAQAYSADATASAVGATAPAAEVFKNPSFDQPATGDRTTGWEPSGAATISNGGFNFNATTLTTNGFQNVALEIGGVYLLSITLRSCTTGTVQVLNGSGNAGQINASGTGSPAVLGAGSLTASVTFTATTATDLYALRGVAGTDAIVESVTLKKQ